MSKKRENYLVNQVRLWTFSFNKLYHLISYCPWQNITKHKNNIHKFFPNFALSSFVFANLEIGIINGCGLSSQDDFAFHTRPLLWKKYMWITAVHNPNNTPGISGTAFKILSFSFFSPSLLFFFSSIIKKEACYSRKSIWHMDCLFNIFAALCKYRLRANFFWLNIILGAAWRKVTQLLTIFPVSGWNSVSFWHSWYHQTCIHFKGERDCLPWNAVNYLFSYILYSASTPDVVNNILPIKINENTTLFAELNKTYFSNSKQRCRLEWLTKLGPSVFQAN